MPGSKSRSETPTLRFLLVRLETRPPSTISPTPVSSTEPLRRFGLLQDPFNYNKLKAFLLIPANLCKVDIASYLDPVTDFERNPVENWSRPRKVLLTDGPLAATAGTPSCTSDFIKAAFERMDVEVEHLVLAAEQIGHCLGCLRAGLLDLA